MSATPRTDRFAHNFAPLTVESCLAFARQLECELATAETARIICNQNAESWRQAYTDEHTRRLQLQESLNAQTDELRMLREDKARLDWLANHTHIKSGNCDVDSRSYYCIQFASGWDYYAPGENKPFRAAIDAARKATP